jgi:hypothetical protein
MPNPIVQTVLGGKTPIYANQINAGLKDSALPAIGAATKVQGSPAVNITLNKPSTVVSGHAMIMGYYAQNPTPATPPTGWTMIRADSCAGGTMASYYKVAGSGEPASYTWTLGNTYYAAAMIDVGATASNPVDAIAPIACGGTPTLAGLATTAQPENVIVIGAGVNGNVTQVGFSQGSFFALQPASGSIPISGAYLTANYATTPTVTLTGGGAAEAAQMIAIKSASAYAGSPVLQGDGYVEATNIVPTAGSANASIGGFNLDGRFNVKNPAFGAKGDGLSDDTASIQAAYNAACTAAVAGPHPQTVYFPSGTYLTSFSLIANCAAPVAMRGESQGTAVIQAVSGGLFPIVMLEGSGYLSGISASAATTAASLATGGGSSLNWGATSQQFYDLKDAQVGGGATGWSNAKPINGASALSFEGFLNYAGGAPGTIYIAESAGDDLGLGNNASSAMQLYLVPGSPNKLAGCVMTTGSGFVCTAAGGSITAGTTYEFEWSYDGSNLRIFEGVPGGTTTLAGSAAATGTIIEQPSEVLGLGDGGTGFTITGWNFQAANHWIGQLDSIRVSNVARHTAAYTAPTAKFASDGNTLLLMNNLAHSDVLVQVTNVVGLNSTSQPVWIPIHSTALVGGNIHSGFFNLTFSGGNYGILGIGVLYTTLDHVSAGGASHDGVKFWNNCYGTQINHLSIAANPFSEAGLVMSQNSGLVNLQWIFQTGSYYGMELLDAGGVYSMLFLNPGSNQVAGIDMAASALFHSYSIHEIAIDFESGGTQVPVKIWGTGTFEIFGGDFQSGNNNALQVAPINGEALGLTLVGGNVVTGGSPLPLIGWKGTAPPLTPATWINPVVNNKSLSASGVPLSDNTDYAQALSDVTIMPTKTVATLPTCNAAAKGWSAQIKDCNANCSTYLGTAFTGGGTTRSTVQCNGTAWELH